LDANQTMIQKGPYYGVDLSAQGGATRTTYFASTQVSKETGSIQPNDQLKAALRLNLTFVPSDKWTVEARSADTMTRTTVDLGLTSEKRLRAIQYVPGDHRVTRAVAHHRAIQQRRDGQKLERVVRRSAHMGQGTALSN
jgi:hypothetical protein